MTSTLNEGRGSPPGDGAPVDLIHFSVAFAQRRPGVAPRRWGCDRDGAVPEVVDRSTKAGGRPPAMEPLAHQRELRLPRSTKAGGRPPAMGHRVEESFDVLARSTKAGGRPPAMASLPLKVAFLPN